MYSFCQAAINFSIITRNVSGLYWIDKSGHIYFKVRHSYFHSISDNNIYRKLHRGILCLELRLNANT